MNLKTYAAADKFYRSGKLFDTLDQEKLDRSLVEALFENELLSTEAVEAVEPLLGENYLDAAIKTVELGVNKENGVYDITVSIPDNVVRFLEDVHKADVEVIVNKAVSDFFEELGTNQVPEIDDLKIVQAEESENGLGVQYDEQVLERESVDLTSDVGIRKLDIDVELSDDLGVDTLESDLESVDNVDFSEHDVDSELSNDLDVSEFDTNLDESVDSLDVNELDTDLDVISDVDTLETGLEVSSDDLEVKAFDTETDDLSDHFEETNLDELASSEEPIAVDHLDETRLQEATSAFSETQTISSKVSSETPTTSSKTPNEPTITKSLTDDFETSVSSEHSLVSPEVSSELGSALLDAVEKSRDTGVINVQGL